MELKLYDLFIEEDLNDNSGVDDISAVDNGAIGQKAFAFAKQLKRVKIVFGQNKGDFQPIEGDKQILAGALMIPDMEIYRIDDNGTEYNVRFKAEEIAKIQKKFKRLGYNNNINIMHDPNNRIKDSVMFQDFIIDRKMGINPPLGQDHLPDGTWFGFVYVGDKTVWDEFIKTGIYTEYSVGGNFYEQEVNDLSDADIDMISNSLGNI